MYNRNRVLWPVICIIYIVMLFPVCVDAQIPDDNPDDIFSKNVINVEGYYINIYGICYANDVPDIMDLIEIYDPSDCVKLELLEAWDCQNPISTWQYYKLYRVYFEPGCEDDFAFRRKSDGGWQNYSFGAPNNSNANKSGIFYACGIPVKNEIVDYDEPIYFTTRVKQTCPLT